MRRVHGVEELDVTLVAGGQAFPVDARLEIDGASRAIPLDERGASVRATARPRRSRAIARFRPPRPSILEDVVERDVELAHDRVKRPDGRLDPLRLDLGHKAGRDI